MDVDRLNVAKPFAYVSIIKVSLTQFAPNPLWDHHNLTVFLTIVSVMSSGSYAIQALFFSSSHFVLICFWHIYLNVVFYMLFTYYYVCN